MRDKVEAGRIKVFRWEIRLKWICWNAHATHSNSKLSKTSGTHHFTPGQRGNWERDNTINTRLWSKTGPREKWGIRSVKTNLCHANETWQNPVGYFQISICKWYDKRDLWNVKQIEKSRSKFRISLAVAHYVNTTAHGLGK